MEKKRRMSFETFEWIMNEWVIPLGLLALIVLAVLWIAGG